MYYPAGNCVGADCNREAVMKSKLDELQRDAVIIGRQVSLFSRFLPLGVLLFNNSEHIEPTVVSVQNHVGLYRPICFFSPNHLSVE